MGQPSLLGRLTHLLMLGVIRRTLIIIIIIIVEIDHGDQVTRAEVRGIGSQEKCPQMHHLAVSKGLLEQRCYQSRGALHENSKFQSTGANHSNTRQALCRKNAVIILALEINEREIEWLFIIQKAAQLRLQCT